MPVSRETLAELEAQLGLPDGAAGQIDRLLGALDAEPDPHTSVSDPARALEVHVRDSLSALGVRAMRSAERIADIGAGAGFPGLPLAIALPRARVDLIEAARRKTDVIARLAGAAGIDNAQPVNARVEEWAASEGAGAYDVAMARAVAPLAVLVEYAAPLLRPGGTFIAWKGAREPGEEAAGGRAASVLGLEVLEPVPVAPFEGVRELYLHLYSKVGKTPARYPRRAGMAVKRPLGAEK